MKFPLIALIAFAGIAGVHAQQAAPQPAQVAGPAEGAAAGEPAAPQLPQIEVDLSSSEAKAAKEEFDKLKVQDQEAFFKLLGEGEKLLAERRVIEALQKFNDAEAYWPMHPNLLNLKGAALVNVRDFEKATVYFENGVRIYPAFWQTRFNLAEMKFVRHLWDEADAEFTALLEKEKQMDAATRKLIEYKVILTKIKRKQFDEASKMIGKYDIFDETPIYYYANAAMHFEKEERRKAEEWVTNARAIFSQQVNAIYEDSLTELGWLFVF